MKKQHLVPILTILLFLLLSSMIYLEGYMSFSVSGSIPKSYEQQPTVIIDAGHGGQDAGATGVDGIVEKDINLNISLKLRDMFEFFGFDVIMTRETDEGTHDADANTVSEKKKSDIINRYNLLEQTDNAIFISVHQNIFGSSSANGSQVWYAGGNENSSILAQSLQDSLKHHSQPENKREIKEAESNLYILSHTTKTAVMVECGFLSNQQEAHLLIDDEYQNKISFAILSGTLDYFE